MGDLVVSKKEQFIFRQVEEFRQGKLSRKQVAVLLNISERSVTRIAERIRLKGIEGLKHGNYKRKPVNKLESHLRAQVISLKRERYFDFNLVHFQEMLEKNHGILVKYTTLVRWCELEKVPKKTKQRRPSRKRILRERMANEGLMLQMDGSDHQWNGKDFWCCIGMIDDATSEIPHAEFFSVENTVNCMSVLRAVVEQKGVPVSIYADRAKWFGGARGQDFSQFVRACEELGIQVINAQSPEAKGRIERSWKTFQDRLVPELRLNNITSIKEANFYLKNTFLREYWPRNTVFAQNKESRYKEIPIEFKDNLNEVFCNKTNRFVRRDNTIFFKNRIYKISDGIGSLAHQTITIHEYEDGTWAAYQANHKLQVKEFKMPLRRWG